MVFQTKEMAMLTKCLASESPSRFPRPRQETNIRQQHFGMFSLAMPGHLHLINPTDVVQFHFSATVTPHSKCQAVLFVYTFVVLHISQATERHFKLSKYTLHMFMLLVCSFRWTFRFFFFCCSFLSFLALICQQTY